MPAIPRVGLVLTCATLVVACSSSEPDVDLASLRPPESWTSEQQEVIDAYGTFRTELSSTTATLDGDLSVLESLSTPRLGEALVDTLVGGRSVGEIITGPYEFTPLDVTFSDDDTSVLTICAWDQTVVSNEGDQLTEIPEGPTTAKVEMQRPDAAWLVNGIFDGEGVDCEL